VRLGTLRPTRGSLAIGRRMGSGRVPCGPARCRRACGHAGMWPSVHRPILCLRQRSQVLDQMSTREMAARNDLDQMSTREMVARNDLDGDESHGAWASGQHGATTLNSLGLLGSKGARTVVGARRGEAVAGVGAATSARRRYSADGAGALSG
jgi:hypothetical protein